MQLFSLEIKILQLLLNATFFETNLVKPKKKMIQSNVDAPLKKDWTPLTCLNKATEDVSRWLYVPVYSVHTSMIYFKIQFNSIQSNFTYILPIISYIISRHFTE